MFLVAPACVPPRRPRQAYCTSKAGCPEVHISSMDRVRQRADGGSGEALGGEEQPVEDPKTEGQTPLRC